MHRTAWSLAIIVAALAATPVGAAEPSGCDKFAWPLAQEQQLLGQASPVAGQPVELDRDAGRATLVALAPQGDAKLPVVPERKSRRQPAFAGYLRFAPAAGAKSYKVSLSSEAWIDLVQDGRYLKPLAFTGATDCANVRKSVKFEIGPQAFTLQLSDVPAASIAVVLTPVE